jgi:hypothetical protein
LHERGTHEIFRGDEAFGCRAAPTPAAVYRNMKCNVLGDYAPDSVRPFVDLLPEQRRPEQLEQRPAETLHAWRDRLNAQFELPYVIGPLNDLKYGYLDVIHPLVSRRIVEQVRGLPDALRTNKTAFKSIVEAAPLDVPFAKYPAIVSPDVVLRQPQVVRVLSNELRRQSEGSGTVAALAGHALELLAEPDALCGRLPTRMSRLVEQAQRRLSRAPKLSPHRIAFRTYIIGKTHALLQQDARALH